MARSKIRNATVELNSDDGSVIYSIINGEQFKDTYTVNWLTDLDNVLVTNQCLLATTATGNIADLEVVPNRSYSADIDKDQGGPQDFTFELEHDIIGSIVDEGDNLVTDVAAPTLTTPVYFIFGIRIAQYPTSDLEADDDQILNVWKPVRGIIQVNFSATKV